jgi:fumiquinazoline A oxidase
LQIVVEANFVYAGPLQEGQQLIQPFLNLQPYDVNITMIEWQDIPSSILYGATSLGCSPEVTSAYLVPYGVNFYQIDVDALINLVNFMSTSMAATPAVQTALVSLSQYAPFGFQLLSEDSSAYPYRNVVIFA